MDGADEHSEQRCSMCREVEKTVVRDADKRAGDNHAPSEL